MAGGLREHPTQIELAGRDLPCGVGGDLRLVGVERVTGHHGAKESGEPLLRGREIGRRGDHRYRLDDRGRSSLSQTWGGLLRAGAGGMPGRHPSSLGEHHALLAQTHRVLRSLVIVQQADLVEPRVEYQDRLQGNRHVAHDPPARTRIPAPRLVRGRRQGVGGGQQLDRCFPPRLHRRILRGSREVVGVGETLVQRESGEREGDVVHQACELFIQPGQHGLRRPGRQMIWRRVPTVLADVVEPLAQRVDDGFAAMQ